MEFGDLDSGLTLRPNGPPIVDRVIITNKPESKAPHLPFKPRPKSNPQNPKMESPVDGLTDQCSGAVLTPLGAKELPSHINRKLRSSRTFSTNHTSRRAYRRSNSSTSSYRLIISATTIIASTYAPRLG